MGGCNDKISGIPYQAIRKQGMMFLTNPKTGDVEKIIFTADTDFGLEDDARFDNNIKVKGNITLEKGGLNFSDGTTLTTAAAASGAPTDAQYLVVGSNSSLTNERVFAGGTGISAVDGGSGQSYTLSFDANNLSSLGQSVSNSDFIVIYDSANSASKKALVSNLPFTNNTGDITGVSVSGTGLAAAEDSGVVTVTISPDEVAGAFSAESVGVGAINGISEVAISGDYNDLANAPTIPTNNNELSNGAGYTTNAGTVTSVGITASSLIDVSGGPVTSSGNITVSVDLSELADGTASINGAQDELVYLDNGSQKRKLVSEIDLGQFNNDQGWTSNTGTVTPSSSDTLTNKTINGNNNTISNIGNSALSNSSITVTAGTGISGGGSVSLGDSVTINNGGVTSAVAGTGVSVSSASGDVTFTNSGVTSIVAGSGISISGGTGAVTITASSNPQSLPVAYGFTSQVGLLQSNATSSTVNWNGAFSTNSNVVSSVSSGIFSIASTGVYRVTGFLPVLVDGGQNRNNVKIRLKFVDGSNTSVVYESSTITVTNTGTTLEIAPAFYTFSDASTRTVQMQILGDAGAIDVLNATDKGYPYGSIEITKLD